MISGDGYCMAHHSRHAFQLGIRFGNLPNRVALHNYHTNSRFKRPCRVIELAENRECFHRRLLRGLSPTEFNLRNGDLNAEPERECGDDWLAGFKAGPPHPSTPDTKNGEPTPIPLSRRRLRRRHQKRQRARCAGAFGSTGKGRNTALESRVREEENGRMAGEGILRRECARILGAVALLLDPLASDLVRLDVRMCHWHAHESDLTRWRTVPLPSLPDISLPASSHRPALSRRPSASSNRCLSFRRERTPRRIPLLTSDQAH